MSHHILIVEDDVMIQGFLILTLENEGFTTTAVGSGSGMFSVLQHEQVDLILLDLGLPDADGMDLIKEIRKNHKMPVVVASARRRTADREAAIDLGADAYVVKPFEPRDLVSQVKLYLGHGSGRGAPKTPTPTPKETDVHDVIKNLAPQPVPPPVQPSPQSSMQSTRNRSDIMVMGSAIIALVAAVMGGGYWYLNYFEDTPTRAEAPAQIAPVIQPPAISKSRPVPEAAEKAKVATEPQNLTETIVVRADPSADSSDALANVPSPIIDTALPQEPVCGVIPDVEWWRVKTHDQVIRYVGRKYQGDWTEYVESWSKRLTKLQDIYQRRKAVKTGSGVVLQDVELAVYINQVAERVAVINCLAEEQLIQAQ